QDGGVVVRDRRRGVLPLAAAYPARCELAEDGSAVEDEKDAYPVPQPTGGGRDGLGVQLPGDSGSAPAADGQAEDAAHQLRSFRLHDEAIPGFVELEPERAPRGQLPLAELGPLVVPLVAQPLRLHRALAVTARQLHDGAHDVEHVRLLMSED